LGSNNSTLSSALKLWVCLSEDLKQRDSRLRPLVEKLGQPTIHFETNYFRALVESILSQQLAPKAALSIIQKFTALEKPFPTTSSILSWPAPRLRRAGVSPQKVKYIRALARAWEKREYCQDWEKLPDDEVITRLTEIKGIGVWTAQMFLIFSLGRPDVLPCGDYGIRRGIMLLFKLPELPHPKEIPGLVPHWSGLSSVASWYLWKSLDQKLLA